MAEYSFHPLAGKPAWRCNPELNRWELYNVWQDRWEPTLFLGEPGPQTALLSFDETWAEELAERVSV